ncbi:unnamed protein product [Fraxinus pennsylvanica]|uniref:Uncharacterized protein n=1 Tax=Fraxinus pennsylvanica TaxID=56036 RepID=A0AAD2ABM4_9LAMI|nr:unnamed protein product [Fraxinus pennsylvanica]
MEGESTSFSIVTVDESTKYGFEWPEMHQSNRTSTVDPYHSHLFPYYKSHELWPSRLENSDSNQLPKLLSSALHSPDASFNSEIPVLMPQATTRMMHLVRAAVVALKVGGCNNGNVPHRRSLSLQLSSATAEHHTAI